ncbi:lipid phosphate phosphatase 1 [Tanacetum coccineum]
MSVTIFPFIGLLYALLITAVLTDSIKDATGRPRPNFFYRCFPDGKPAFADNGDVLCHGDVLKIKEGYKSFPSGHTSFVSPYLFAALVGVSRVDDYWHHWTDVFTGAIIGTTVAAFCYLQFFPFPNAQNGWAPHAFLATMERERVQNREVVTAPLPDLEA